MALDDIRSLIPKLAKQERLSYGARPVWTGADFEELTGKTALALPHEPAFILRNFGPLLIDFIELPVHFASGSSFTVDFGAFLNTADRIAFSTKQLQENRFGTPQVVEPARIPEGYLVAGQIEGGRSRLLFDGIDPENNTVYAWGNAYDAWGTGDNTMGLGTVAESVVEFLELIESAPRAPERGH